MNILYLADPNSIHDARWINFFAEKETNRCFVIYRAVHQKSFSGTQSLLLDRVTILAAVRDCSTVRPWRNWTDVLRIKAILLKYSIQVFHILYAEPNALWANWKWLWRVPVVITTRGTDILKTIPSFFKGSSMLSKMVARQYVLAFRNADYITGTSSRQIEILKSFGISTSCEVVRTGVNFNLIRSAVVEETVLNGIQKPFVLMPRHMKPVYHHEFTMDAIALLDRSITEKFSFVFLNSDTQEQAYFHQIRKKSESVNARIYFIPSLLHRSLLGLVRHASLVIMNPLSDGSPVTAMEAMACEVPVILSPGYYDQDVFGSTFTFDEWSPVSLTNKITEVLTMPLRDLERYAAKNYLLVLKAGNREIEMNKVCKIYDALLRSGKVFS